MSLQVGRRVEKEWNRVSNENLGLYLDLFQEHPTYISDWICNSFSFAPFVISRVFELPLPTLVAIQACRL